MYAIDNERNRNSLEFYAKVSADPTYEPQTPLEHYLNNDLEEIWNDYCQYCDDNDIPMENRSTREACRGYYATELAYTLITYKWIEETEE